MTPRSPQSDWHRTMERTWQKWGKSTDHDQNLVTSEGGQDTSACQISAHSCNTFSRKCLETTNLTCFTKLNAAKMRKTNRAWPKCKQFPRYTSMSNFRPFLQIWPVVLNQNGAKKRKINRPWPKCNQFWRWYGYISMSNFRPFKWLQ